MSANGDHLHLIQSLKPRNSSIYIKTKRFAGAEITLFALNTRHVIASKQNRTSDRRQKGYMLRTTCYSETNLLVIHIDFLTLYANTTLNF